MDFDAQNILSPADKNRKITQLVRQLRETEQQLCALTGGQPGLPAEVREKLRQETQQRQTEAALREQSMLLDNAQRIGRMGSWGFDQRGGCLTWSEATCALFGITRAEFRGTFEHFKSFILPEDLPVLDSIQTQISPEHPFFEVEYRIRRADGKVRWMCSHGSVEFDPAGVPLRRFGMVMDVTELRAARAQVEQNNALLRIAGRIARLGAWTIDLPEQKLTWSDETCLIHDYPPGYQPTLEEGLALFPPEYRPEVVRLVEACARDGTPYEFEVPKMTAKGRRIWVRSVGEAKRDAEGRITRLQGAFQDITERKLAELELARLNRALRMLSACGKALLYADEELQLLTEICRLVVELGGYRMAWVGYARDDAQRTIEPMAHFGVEEGYLSIGRISWSADDPAGRGPAGRAIRTGQLAVCANVAELEIPDFWRQEALARGYLVVITLPLRDESRTFGLLGLYSSEASLPGADELKLLQELADNLAFGITNLRTRAERRKTRQEIIQKAALLDLATDAIIVRDLAHCITFWNQGAERIYGWKAREVLGRSMRDFLSADPATLDFTMSILLQRGEWKGELRKKSQAGQPLTMDCRWTLVRDELGQPAAILCIETNITEKKKLEAQFLRTQRMESIGTLAGGMAHDLNNILAPILIATQILKQGTQEAETLKILNTMEVCARRGANLVKQVLSFARGIEGQRIVVDVGRVLAELQQVMREVLPKNVEMELVEGAGLWPVIGDPTQLHQVFLNLCVNARDAMSHGGKITVTVENMMLDEAAAALHAHDKPGVYLQVSVRDTGPGIPPAVLDKIFEPFFTTKEHGKGTGLGLSTALGIVKSHGGFIQVHSEPGAGAEFQVYLPANTTPAEPVAPGSPQFGLFRGHGELILLTDDEASIRQVCGSILERSGYRVLLAANGSEALDLYCRRQSEIAAIVTDISMPVMDGTALIHALKAVNPQVRVIVSSGLPVQDGVAQALEAGARHFIAKPYEADKLLKILHEELAEKAG